ncbi:MAG: 50S ribosomal protein L18e [Methanosarcinaceae archaeon]
MSRKSQQKITRKTNLRIPALISVLKGASRDNDAPIWKDIAKRLEKPSRQYAAVNMSTINRHSAENEVVIIAGKVLGAGALGHAVTVVALGFSGVASKKINEVGGKCLTIEQMLNESPSGSGIRILQ